VLATVRKAGTWVSRIPARGSKVDRRQHLWAYKFNHLMELHLKQKFERPGENVSELALILHGKRKNGPSGV
jgi:hypothetical protein